VEQRIKPLPTFSVGVRLRHSYLGSFFLEPGDIMSIRLGKSGALVKQQGSLERLLGHKAYVI
jgi:hypothetical protein